MELDRPTPPPRFACTPPPLPITPPLDNTAASPVHDGPTDQIDPLSLSNPTSSGIRCRINNPGPAATPSPPPSAEIARSEGIARQIRREQVAGGIPDRERAGQRMSGKTSSTSDPRQKSSSGRQPFPPATSFFQPSDVLEPSLLVQEVQPRCNSTFGKGVGSLEGSRGLVFAKRSEPGVLRINPPRTPSTSDSGIQHISEKSRGRPYGTSDILGQQNPLPVAPVLRLPCDVISHSYDYRKDSGTSQNSRPRGSD